MTYEEETVTSPLCEPGVALGTIIEAREGSTSGESEQEITLNTPSPTPTIAPDPDPTTPVKDARTDEEWQHPDVDGGWAWVVLTAVFFVFAITAGLLYTTGLYYVQMLEEYGQTRSYTAWMGSLANAFFMLGGPLSSAFIQRWGCRAALMVGSVLMTTGYIASAFTSSLEMLFFTFGIVVVFSFRRPSMLQQDVTFRRARGGRQTACGMNFCYSGQIIALAQYFDRRQSLATSGAMIGIGLGMFFMSSLLEHVIQQYGWRVSFLFNAAVSLQIVVMGALVYPLYPTQPKDAQDHLDLVASSHASSATIRGVPTSRSRVFFDKSINDKSFSSLRLSAGASYLSHSLLSLTEGPIGRRPTTNHDPGITSNQHSFASQYAVTGIRSNHQSFSTRDSQPELIQMELRGNQFSFHGRESTPDCWAPYRYYATPSRRTSMTGLNMMGGASRGSQPELPGGDVEGRHDAPKAAHFLIREGDCDLSCCVDELEEPGTSAHQQCSRRDDRRSLCTMLLKKIKTRAIRILTSLYLPSDHPMLDARVWLMNFSVLLCMVGTLTLYIIYKDFAKSVGLSEYYSMALSGIGIGDLCGRVGTGLVLTLKFVDAVFMYGMVMLLCSLLMAGHLFITTPASLLALTTTFGFLYGSMNVLIAVAPSKEFGKDKLVIVFGYILFFGGIGALVGAPLAGYIVDLSGDYAGVIWLSVMSLVIAAVLMFLCFLISQRRRRHVPVEQLPGDHL